MKSMKDRYAIGARLREIREERNLNQTQVAEKMGVQQNTVSKIESGSFNPSVDMVIKYCQAINKKIFL